MKQILGTAEPIVWPEGKKAACAFTFDIDAESPLLHADPTLSKRMGMILHQSYGPLVGIPRILGIMHGIGISGSFYVPGYTARRYPQQISAIAEADHEIGHHGHLHERITQATESQERTFLERGFAALDKVLGIRPVGYRAPLWQMNWRTPSLLGEAGFLYDSSLMDADMPYELAYGENGDSIVELPINWILDDWELYAFIPDFTGSGVMATPDKAITSFRAEFDALREIGGLFVLTCHPFLSGRPGRAAALAKFMEYVAGCNDVWIAKMSDIAAHVRSLSLPPRTLSEPDPSLGSNE